MRSGASAFICALIWRNWRGIASFSIAHRFVSAHHAHEPLVFPDAPIGGIVSRLMADIALAQNFVGSAMTASGWTWRRA
jgi:hypothetical protein